MRADRLLSILLCLQSNGKMNTRELAAKMEVSERTILRDMDALSATGVPVLSERGAAGGWSLMEGYRTNLTGLKKEEIQSLLLASATPILGDLGLLADFEMASLKLLASLPLAIQQDAAFVRQRIHVDGAGWYKSIESFPCLAIIQDAIWAERKLKLNYLREGQVVERLVDPLGMVAKGTIWYLVARVDSEYRTYRISRVQQAETTDQSFSRPDGFELAAYWEQSTLDFKANLPQYPALIKIQIHALTRLQNERYITIQEIRSSEEAWMTLSVHCQTVETACQSILSYGPVLEVLEPEELRNRVKASIAAMSTLY
jgi:predicted DNA-binding transcriptional regulator YafY